MPFKHLSSAATYMWLKYMYMYWMLPATCIIIIIMLAVMYTYKLKETIKGKLI